jgi:hypothetical protein
MVAIHGLLVAFLPLDPTFAGVKPGLRRLIFVDGKIRSTTSFGREVKPSVACDNILLYVKDPFLGKIQYFIRNVSLASLLDDCCKK